jgi:cytochrome c biogenesis protein CcdA
MTTSIAHPLPNVVSQTPKSKSNSAGRILIAVILILVTTVLAVTWFVPVLLQGGDQLTKTTATRSQMSASISEFMTRQADGKNIGLKDGDVNILYATPKYFQVSGKADQAAQYNPDQYVIFILNEEVHSEDLPLSPPDVALKVDGEREYTPEASPEVLIDSYHHRSSIVRFPITAGKVQNILDGAASVELTLTPVPGTRAKGTSTVEWDLPVEYPARFEQGQNISAGTVLALVAGLLASLSPCLAQLTACYLSTLAGVGMRLEGETENTVRWRVLRTAFLFVVGFTLVYTLAGAIAGWAGQQIQASGLLVKWSTPLSIAAGVLLIVMGVWVAANARAPLVCNMPMPSFMRLSKKGGVFGPIILGLAFAIGCATCFSGALFAALLLYLGTTASAAQGAMILFIFSLGVAIPYLLAAGTLSQALPLLDRLGRAAPLIGLFSGIVIVGFGILMLTGNFHGVSDELYNMLKWMSLLKTS